MFETWDLGRWLLVTTIAIVLTLLQPQHVFARPGASGVIAGSNDVALELTVDSFNTSLWAASTPTAIVEFYAHWCPVCQKFAPQYERVAKLFNGRSAPYPGILLMTKVDCAKEANRKLCNRFNIQHYPTMLWGKPSVLAWGSRLPEDDKIELEQIPSASDSQKLLGWINTKLTSSYSLDAVRNDQQLEETSNHVIRQVPSILDIEEATDESYALILSHELVNSVHRAPFARFLQLLEVHHPSKRCRVGSARILFNLMDLWPVEHVLEAGDHMTEGEDDKNSVFIDVDALRKLHICEEDLSLRTYKSCSMGTAGYSCGLWYLFHALSVRVDNMESGIAVRTISEFVRNFFSCEECRDHFLKLSEPAIETVRTRRALVLWLWHAHNEVNGRLALEAAKGTLEISAPKVQWPTLQMCPSCRTVSETMHGNTDEDVQWDEDNVYQFLRKAYGPPLETTAAKVQTAGDKLMDAGSKGAENMISSSSIAVPAGAALCIAVASCGFGIAACCWRVQQKKRKHMRRRI